MECILDDGDYLTPNLFPWRQNKHINNNNNKKEDVLVMSETSFLNWIQSQNSVPFWAHFGTWVDPEMVKKGSRPQGKNNQDLNIWNDYVCSRFGIEKLETTIENSSLIPVG